jgi:small-conductance mechanosensitive channel
MEKITDLTQVGLSSLAALGETLMSASLNILGAIFLIVMGWVIAKITSFVVRRVLKTVGFDKLSEKLNLDEILVDNKLNISPSQLVGKFVYWVIILLFFVTASDTLGWAAVSQSISGLLTYLPQLFSAIVVFVIGFYIATFVKKGLQGILSTLAVSSARIISSLAFYLIVIIVSLAALNQAGIDTSVVTANMIIIIGGVVLAFAISFGIGSRDILTNILSSFYSKSNFQVGQDIEIGDVKGVIQKIDITSCVLTTATGTVVIPVKTLLTKQVVMKPV